MRSLGLLAMVFAVLLSGCATSSETNGLTELINQHTAAMGGEKALEATRTIEYHIQIVEPSFTVEGVYVADRQGRMRIDIYSAGTRVYTEAYDGTHAWEMSDDGKAQDSDAAGAAALWHGTQFPGKLLGLHEMALNGHTLKLADDEILDGSRYHVIRLTYKDGFVTDLYLNSKTLLIERQRDERALHPAVNSATHWLENQFDDYRQLDGVMRSYSSRQMDIEAGTVLQTSTVSSLRVNVPLSDELFHFGSAPARESL